MTHVPADVDRQGRSVLEIVQFLILTFLRAVETVVSTGSWSHWIMLSTKASASLVASMITSKFLHLLPYHVVIKMESHQRKTGTIDYIRASTALIWLNIQSGCLRKSGVVARLVDFVHEAVPSALTRFHEIEHWHKF